MKNKETTESTSVTVGILDATIDVEAYNENDEFNCNELKFRFGQRVDCALSTEVSISCVSKKDILQLAENIKSLAKHFKYKD
jgi:hypothetical protein